MLALCPVIPIGGSAKGIVVREVDALGGEWKPLTRLISDEDAQHWEGQLFVPLRARLIKELYSKGDAQTVEIQENLTPSSNHDWWEDFGGRWQVVGVRTATHQICCQGCSRDYRDGPPWKYHRRPQYSSVLTTAWLALTLLITLKELGLVIGRLQTEPLHVSRPLQSTTMWQKFSQEASPNHFSYTSRDEIMSGSGCHAGWPTNGTSHELVQTTSTVRLCFTGVVKGVGPRYCRREDKIVRFADKSHQLFLDEGLQRKSMSKDFQPFAWGCPTWTGSFHQKFGKCRDDANWLRHWSMHGLPHQLRATLETKKISGLSLLVETNGTSGYEEALGRGLSRYQCGLKNPKISLNWFWSVNGFIWGDDWWPDQRVPLNLTVFDQSCWVPFLILHHDNADMRLTEMGREIDLWMMNVGLALKSRKSWTMRWSVSTVSNSASQGNQCQGWGDGLQAVDRCSDSQGIPSPSRSFLPRCGGLYRTSSRGRMTRLSNWLKRNQTWRLYFQSHGSGCQDETHGRKTHSSQYRLGWYWFIATEARQKFKLINPETIGQASRISGVNPADISILMVYLEGKKS